MTDDTPICFLLMEDCSWQFLFGVIYYLMHKYFFLIEGASDYKYERVTKYSAVVI